MRRALLLLAGVLLQSTIPAMAQSTRGALIPLEHFTRGDEFGTAKISPDGEFLALTRGRNGRSMLVFISLKEQKPISGLQSPERFEFYDFQWVSPTRLIYWIAERLPGLKQPVPTGEIFAIDRDGRAQKHIYGYRAGESTTGTHLKKTEYSYATAALISTLQDNPKHILIAEQPWRLRGNYWQLDRDARPEITRLDVYTGSKMSLGRAPLKSATILVDRNDQVRFALGLNDRFQLAVSWKPQPSSEWTAFDLPGFRNESVIPREFSADNRSVLFTGVRAGESLSALYKIDLETQAVEKLHAFEHGDIEDLVTDFAGRELIGVRGYEARPAYHWLAKDNPAAKLYTALQRAFPGQDVNVTSATDDGRLAIAFVSSDTNPGDYYLFDSVNKKADYMQATRAWIDPKLMRPKEPISLQARDGLALHGYVTKPAGEGPHPTVVLPHGGPYGVRDSWDFDPEVQLLASRGYAVLQVNFRGSHGYGMDFVQAGYREWGGKMQDDITDATRWAVEQKIAAGDRICIFGASYGGFAALMGAAREPQLYRCAIGYAGVYDLELMYTTGDVRMWGSGRDYLETVLGSDVADLRSRSPVHHAQRIEAPVMLIHGKADWRVDYDHATSMRKALENQRKTVEWMALSGEGHGVYDEQTRKQMYEAVLAFLDRNLGVSRAAAAP